jgi:hypothetical protein
MINGFIIVSHRDTETQREVKGEVSMKDVPLIVSSSFILYLRVSVSLWQ